MKFLFVKSNKVGSRLIRWGLKGKTSHFAICFDEDVGVNCGIVFHSYGTRGTHLIWMSEFLESNQIVYALAPAKADEEETYRAVVSAERGQGYDYKALLWWAWRGFLFRILGKPIPSSNKWQQNGYSLCTNLAKEPLRLAGMDLSEIDLEMITPDGLYKLMVSNPCFKKVI